LKEYNCSFISRKKDKIDFNTQIQSYLDIIKQYKTKSIINCIANTNTYSSALAKLFDQYKNEDIGKELTFISVALSTNDPGALKEAGKVGNSYKSFGRDLLKITVPNTLTGIHLALANDYEKVGETIDGMSVMLDDPITGMKSIINYKKYSDALVSDIEKLSTALE
jgi:hypothetical protein